jgi:alpha-aminoadipate carrier protein LysW
MIECVLCGCEITLPNDAVVGELITCTDCGSELEVIGINPFAIKEAPQEEEDWGE